jgi:hypothetical protein
MIATPATSTIPHKSRQSIARRVFPTSRIVPNAIPPGMKMRLKGVAEMMNEFSVLPVTFLEVMRLMIQRAMI